MTRPQAADGGDSLQTWKAAANIQQQFVKAATNHWTSWTEESDTPSIKSDLTRLQLLVEPINLEPEQFTNKT